MRNGLDHDVPGTAAAAVGKRRLMDSRPGVVGIGNRLLTRHTAFKSLPGVVPRACVRPSAVRAAAAEAEAEAEAEAAAAVRTGVRSADLALRVGESSVTMCARGLNTSPPAATPTLPVLAVLASDPRSLRGAGPLDCKPSSATDVVSPSVSTVCPVVDGAPDRDEGVRRSRNVLRSSFTRA